MAYVVPSVLVYQQLASNGGVANVTPDLDACIIGPCYNVVPYVAGSASSLIQTQAMTSPSGGSAAVLSNNTVLNTFYLGSTKPGQAVDASSVQVYFNDASVETKLFQGTGAANSNTITVNSATGVLVSINSGSNQATLSAAQPNLYPGHILSIPGAGTGGATLLATVNAVAGTAVTLASNASTTVINASGSWNSFNNLNLNSSTLRAEAGDTVVITYGSSVVVTSVLSVSSTNNVVFSIQTADVLPTGITSPFTVSIQKNFNNLLLPKTHNSHTNYSDSNVTVNGSVDINPLPSVSYGVVVSGNVHIAYKALRIDLSASVLDINSVSDQQGVLGEATDENPLALGVNLALANTTGRIRAITIPSNDLSGYLAALDLAENNRLYAIVPLTQNVDILAAVQQHVEQMSTPENASWRIALVNTAVPTVQYVGQFNPNLVNANGGNNSVTFTSGAYVLNSSNSQFVSDGVIPGDYVKVVSHATTVQTITSMKVLSVISNQQVVVEVSLPLTAVNFYVQRTLTRTQQASAIAAASTTFTSSRVIHVQPDLAGINIGGVTKYLPGYYLCCALAGLTSGLPAQQGLTNIAPAGIADLSHSNFYFTRAQMSTISAAGTCILVQESQGTLPYIRHSLTTDMSVLQYRELQQVKNVDFLSYFFHDILKSFPGRYNITADTLQILRTTLIAGAKLLQGKRLPKIGAPLLDYQIKTLKQDENNKDQVVIEMPVTMPTVMNYINLYLIY